MISAVTSVFGSIFGTKKAQNDLLDKDDGLLVKAGSFVNNLHFSEAEKAEHSLEVHKMLLERLKALEPFKIVQRILAFGIISTWWVVVVNVLAAIWIHAVTLDCFMVDGIETCTSIDARTDMLAFAFSDFVFWPVLILIIKISSTDGRL